MRDLQTEQLLDKYLNNPLIPYETEREAQVVRDAINLAKALNESRENEMKILDDLFKLARVQAHPPIVVRCQDIPVAGEWEAVR